MKDLMDILKPTLYLLLVVAAVLGAGQLVNDFKHGSVGQFYAYGIVIVGYSVYAFIKCTRKNKEDCPNT